ncbi:hypothetical protein D9M68_712570 [compost metagenome]
MHVRQMLLATVSGQGAVSLAKGSNSNDLDRYCFSVMGQFICILGLMVEAQGWPVIVTSLRHSLAVKQAITGQIEIGNARSARGAADSGQVAGRDDSRVRLASANLPFYPGGSAVCQLTLLVLKKQRSSATSCIR